MSSELSCSSIFGIAHMRGLLFKRVEIVEIATLVVVKRVGGWSFGCRWDYPLRSLGFSLRSPAVHNGDKLLKVDLRRKTNKIT